MKTSFIYTILYSIAIACMLASILDTFFKENLDVLLYVGIVLYATVEIWRLSQRTLRKLRE